ncbi:MAG: glutamate--tRNA ligase [Oscillospiraceae bacterium]|nr:glutamate--tRNA ligase [Oscillospiraceae bacterium]
MQNNNENKVRTRFAPSPTGYMHVGNLRTALYSFLLAKKHGGTFLIRIEDTDQERYVEGATEIIYKSLSAAGIVWDEGPGKGGEYGPYIQSERKGLYKEYAEKLVESGGAYLCFCGKQRLDEVRSKQKAAGIAPMYDGHCRDLSRDEISKKTAAGVSCVIRQKMPRAGTSSFIDSVFGEISVENTALDDQILIKTDGMPTYNFANVIDDHLMAITHVVRGNEYLAQTPKYNLLYDSFGWKKPEYIHCPMIMSSAGKVLSKRDGSATFEELLEQGFLPDAVINYIALLGWSPKGEREIYALDELIGEFGVSGISKSPAIFDIAKLRAINGEYIRAMDNEQFNRTANEYIRKTCRREDIDMDLLSKMLKPRTETFAEIPEQVDFIDRLPDYNIELYTHKKMKTNSENSLVALQAMLPIFEKIDDWSFDSLHAAIFALIEKLSVKNGLVLWPLRVAVSGKQFTPGGGPEIAALLGRDETISRIKTGIDKLSK